MKQFIKDWAFMFGAGLAIALVFTGEGYLRKHVPGYVATVVFLAATGLVYASVLWQMRRTRDRRGRG